MKEHPIFALNREHERRQSRIASLYSYLHYRESELICIAGEAGTGKTLVALLDAMNMAEVGASTIFLTTDTDSRFLKKMMDAIAYTFNYNLTAIANKVTIVDGGDSLRTNLIFGEAFPYEFYGMHDVVIIDGMSFAAEAYLSPSFFDERIHILRHFTEMFHEFITRHRKIGIITEATRRDWNSSGPSEFRIMDRGLAFIADKIVTVNSKTGIFTIEKNRNAEFQHGDAKIKLPLDLASIHKFIEPAMNMTEYQMAAMAMRSRVPEFRFETRLIE